MAKNKNRKRGDTGPVFPAPLAAILLVVSALALTYLWLNGRCDEMGLRIRELEKSIDAKRREKGNAVYKWSNMTSPQNMQRQLEAHGLIMTWPAEKDIVRVHRSDLAAEAVPEPLQFARNGRAPTDMIHD